MQNIYNKILKGKKTLIAEAGVNHNGNLKIGEKLIDAAKRAGADCIKFQTYKASKLTTKKGASKISRKFLLRGFKIKPKILNFSLINHRFIKAVIKYKKPKKKANIYLFK